MGIETTFVERLKDLLDRQSVIGASLALVNDGTVNVATAGVKDIATGDPVNLGTVFDAASLTKPLVAYAVLQLCDKGVLGLDDPLVDCVQPVIRDDPLAARITVRHILTHTCGLQNLRGKEPLRMFFEPGARFSYSSVGFMYLQLAVEAKTGEPLETTLRRLVFEPLGMHSSSLEWRNAFAANEAIPHEEGERIAAHRAPAANASYSLKTTASDYGAFVAAVLGGARLKEETWQKWLAPAVMVPLREIVRLESAPDAIEPGIGWGLGWGLETANGTFFQWGKMNGTRAFVMGSPERKAGVVLLTNSNTGLRLIREVIASVLPGEHPAARWLSEGVSE
jgi:CubicO group peptidase (beta-lactamase class C family)